MPTTYALIVPTADDLDLKLKQFTAIQKPLIDLVANTLSPDGLSATADYVYNAGPAKDTVGVGVRVNYEPKKDKTSSSLRVTANIRQTVSETGAITDIPIEAGVFLNYGGKNLPDAAAATQALQMAVALIFKDLTGANGNPTSATIEAMDRRVITNLY